MNFCSFYISAEGSRQRYAGEGDKVDKILWLGPYKSYSPASSIFVQTNHVFFYASSHVILYMILHFLAISFVLSLSLSAESLPRRASRIDISVRGPPTPTSHSERHIQFFSETARILKNACLNLCNSYIRFSGSFLCASLRPLATQQQPTLATRNRIRRGQCRWRQ